jgi:hypothetical protein
MGVIGAAVAAVATWLGASGATAAAIGTAVNVAVAAASVASAVKTARDQKKAEQRAQMESNQRNSYRNFRQPLTPRRIIYGRTRVAGPLIFASNESTITAHLVVAIAGHEVDAFESFWLLKDELPVITDPLDPFLGQVGGKYGGTVILHSFLGTADQNIGARIANTLDVRPAAPGGTYFGLPSIIEETDQMAGIAALYVITAEFGISWEGQTPDFAAIVRGKKIYDPRTDTTAWSNNPALCAADYLVNFMGFPYSSIHEETLIASANICDQLVPLKAGGTEKRYECNGALGAEISHDENLTTIVRSMAGSYRYSSGKWFIEAGAPKTPSLPLHENQVLSPYQIDLEKPDRALPNAVRGNFIDPGQWQPTSYPAHLLEDAIAAETPGDPNYLEVDLPLTTSHTQAQRIALIELKRARARESLSLEFDLSALRLRPGNIVTYTSPDLGIDSAQYEIDGFTFARGAGNQNGPALTCRLDLIAYDPTIYDWNPATQEQDILTGIVDIAAVRNKFFEDLTVDERNLITDPSFDADYAFSASNPASAYKTIDTVHIEVTVEITTTDGTTPATQTATATTDQNLATIVIGKGHILPILATYPPGHTYVSHTILNTEVFARYTDNTTSPPQSATLIPGI